MLNFPLYIMIITIIIIIFKSLKLSCLIGYQTIPNNHATEGPK